jgi:hypothetical protein
MSEQTSPVSVDKLVLSYVSPHGTVFSPEVVADMDAMIAEATAAIPQEVARAIAHGSTLAAGATYDVKTKRWTGLRVLAQPGSFASLVTIASSIELIDTDVKLTVTKSN